MSDANPGSRSRCEALEAALKRIADWPLPDKHPGAIIGANRELQQIARDALADSNGDERREEWLAVFERAFDHVPLWLYDEHRKPAEQALGELLRLADSNGDTRRC